MLDEPPDPVVPLMSTVADPPPDVVVPLIETVSDPPPPPVVPLLVPPPPPVVPQPDLDAQPQRQQRYVYNPTHIFKTRFPCFCRQARAKD